MEDTQNVPPNGGTRAWLVTTAALSSQICTMGYFHTWGVFQAYYTSHVLRGESASSIAWIGSIQMTMLNVAGLLSGPLFDRYGAKKVVIPASLGLVLSVMLTSLCKEYYQFVLCQGFLNGLSSGMVLSPTVSTVGQYFTTRRGLAVGVAYTGSAIGGIILPIILNRLVNMSSLGFGWSVRVVGFLMILLLGFTCLVLREHAPRRKTRLFLFDAFRDAPYVLVTLGYGLVGLGFFSPVYFIIDFALDRGMRPDLAYYQVAIVNAGTLVGRIISGRFADSFGHFNTSIFTCLAAAVIIFCWPAVHSNAGIIVFAAVYGLFSGPIPSLFVPCVAHISSKPCDIGTYVGMALGVGGFGVLAGTPASGAIISRYGWWQGAVFSGLALVAGAACYLGAKLLLNRRLLAAV